MSEQKSWMQGAGQEESFSELSVLMQPPKSEQQLKYESLFKQMSGLRSENRELKADNVWLRNAKEGLAKQSETLKQLLRENKQIVKELNAELRTANEEINRIEDLLHAKQIEISQVNTLNQDLVKERNELNIELINHKAQLKAKTSNLQYIEKQCRSLRQNRQQENVKEIEAMNSRITSIVGRFANNHRLNNSKSHRLNNIINQFNSQTNSPNKLISEQQAKLCKTTNLGLYNEKSPSASVFKKQPCFDIIGELQDTLRKQTQMIENRHIEYENLQKNLSISENRISILELQLKEAGQLLEQSRTEHISLLESINKERKQHESIRKQKEEQINSYDRLVREHEKLVRSTYEGFVHKLTTTFSQFLPDEQQTFMKISTLMPYPVLNSSEPLNNTHSNKMTQNKFEIDVLLTELKTAILNKYIHSDDKANEAHEIRKMSQRLRGMQEQYDLLTIRHQTLQRQYEAILEDNRRVLKYNSLSRYRTQRNMRGPETYSHVHKISNPKTFHKETNSQNLMNIGNSSPEISTCTRR